MLAVLDPRQTSMEVFFYINSDQLVLPCYTVISQYVIAIRETKCS